MHILAVRSNLCPRGDFIDCAPKPNLTDASSPITKVYEHLIISLVQNQVERGSGTESQSNQGIAGDDSMKELIEGSHVIRVMSPPTFTFRST